VLKPAMDKDGYEKVGFSKDGRMRQYFVHRLVALAFIENPHDYPSVNHKDENKQNNAVENLEWCTVAYNNGYADGHARRGKKRWVPVSQYTMDGEYVATYDCIKNAAHAVGARSHANISSCCSGNRKTANGYRWKYGADHRLEALLSAWT